MINNFHGIGRLTRDVELRFIKDGKAVTTLGLALNYKYGDKEETTFVDVDFWGKQAEIADQYLRKGSLVYVSGRLKQDTWDQDGQKRSKLKIVGDTIQFLDKKSDDN